MALITPILALMAIGGIAVLAIVGLFRNVLYVSGPNEVLVFSGASKSVTSDGRSIGYRFIKGGRIPALIEYLSSFMTLQAGDVILTGTPEGVVNVNEGDEVVTEIDGIGRLVNHIVGDALFGR